MPIPYIAPVRVFYAVVLFRCFRYVLCESYMSCSSTCSAIFGLTIGGHDCIDSMLLSILHMVGKKATRQATRNNCFSLTYVIESLHVFAKKTHLVQVQIFAKLRQKMLS